MSVPQTTLSAAITTTVATTATVSDVLGFASSVETDDLVQIENEFLLVSGGLGTTSWSSITRGYAGSIAATHLNAATVTRIARAYSDLTRVKAQASIPDTDDDAVLLVYIAAAQAYLCGPYGTGIFLGPSTDTSRIYHGQDALCNGKRLWIPGGIRTLSAMTIGSCTGATQTAATVTDWDLGPLSYELSTGRPYNYIEFADVTTGNWNYFPWGKRNVTLTGTFGPAAVDDWTAKLADMVVIRMWEDRNAGPRSSPTPDMYVYEKEQRILDSLRAEHFAGVW